MNYKPDDIVKSCRKLECGLRLGIEGVHACQLGPFSSPIYWTAEEASKIKITKKMITEKREQLFMMLNDNHSDISCKQCHMVKTKLYKDVKFTRLGHIDLAPSTICNLRCSFCGYTMKDSFQASRYDALAILEEFSSEDVEWDSAVDFNGGEPAILPDVDDYLAYFNSRRIRVFLYSNAVKFRQSIFDGLKNGSIRWVCTSLDAGTPSSFLKIKKKDYYFQVLENLTRYAHAGSADGGNLAVKYIFCKDNCGDDDIAGFVYAMLAIRPQEVWLTFDFEPLSGLSPDLPDLGGLDYSGHVAAYVKMYNMLKKHGLTPVHFSEKHLATVCRHGKILMERVYTELSKTQSSEDTELILKDFRKKEIPKVDIAKMAFFSISPLRIKKPEEDARPWSLEGKRILLAPASQLSVSLLSDLEIKKAQIIGILDRDTVLQGKIIKGVPVYGYDAIPQLNPDYILLIASERHREEIVETIFKYIRAIENIIALDCN